MSDDARFIAAHCYAMRARRLSRKLTRLYEAEMGDVDLTAARFNVLVAIAASPGVQASQLVEPLDIEKSSLSRILSRMEDQGLIASEPIEGSRGRALQATSEGELLIERARPSWERAQAAVEAELGELAEALLD